MEIFGIVRDESGAPVAGAQVQRYYPTGEAYSAPVESASNGFFNGRVPGTDYFWRVSSPGFITQPVSLEGAVSNNEGAPIIVTLERDPLLEIQFLPEPVVVEKPPVAVYVVGGAAAALAAVWLLGSPRDKVRIRKIFN
jgi:hypothetical protein